MRRERRGDQRGRAVGLRRTGRVGRAIEGTDERREVLSQDGSRPPLGGHLLQHLRERGVRLDDLADLRRGERPVAAADEHLDLGAHDDLRPALRGRSGYDRVDLLGGAALDPLRRVLEADPRAALHEHEELIGERYANRLGRALEAGRDEALIELAPGGGAELDAGELRRGERPCGADGALDLGGQVGRELGEGFGGAGGGHAGEARTTRRAWVLCRPRAAHGALARSSASSTEGSMKAAVYYENGGPEVLRYEDVPAPACPPDGVLVDVEVISVEGGDTLHRARTPFTGDRHIVGYQCAGTVRESGLVRARKVGDRVVAVAPNGSHAEIVAANEGTTWAVPEGADLTAVACVPVAFGTAHEALFALGGLTAGQRVLVHAGAGGVGLAAIQLAKAAGAEVLTTASSDEKLARLREFGATHLINYKAGSFNDAITAAIGPNGVDLVIDPVGGKTLQESVGCLRYRGRIVVNLGMAGRDLASRSNRSRCGEERVARRHV